MDKALTNMTKQYIVRRIHTITIWCMSNSHVLLSTSSQKEHRENAKQLNWMLMSHKNVTEN